MNRMPAIMVVLLLVDSLHYVFARLLLPHLPPTTSSFYYMTLALVEIAIFAAATRRIRWHVFRENAGFFLLIGFLIATATAASYAAVVYIDPGTASLLARMSTVFALGFGVVWLKEKLSRGERIGAALAVIGVFVISFQLGETTRFLWLGTALVLLSTFTYALHAAIVKQRGEEMDLTNFFLFRMATTCLFLLIFTLARLEMVIPSGGQVWLILIVTATVNVTISRTLYYLALRRFKLSILTILLTLSPVVTIAWSMLLFDEQPTAQALLGGVAVMAGVIMVTVSKRNSDRLARQAAAGG